MTPQGKGRDDYQTPQFLFDHLDRMHDFTLDAACQPHNMLCARGCIDGLAQSWANERVFCNPPFSTKDVWIEKAYNEVLHGDCPVCVMILPTLSMTTDAWHQYIHGYFSYQFSPSRYSFINPETGQPDDGNNSGTTVIYFIKPLPRQSAVRRGMRT